MASDQNINRGRRPDLLKRERILDSATDHFFSLGFHATSIEGIALDANVSKVTIYKYFSDKEKLFVATVDRECDKIRNQIRLSDDPNLPLKNRLQKIGSDIILFLSRPEMTRFEQRIAAETSTYHDLGVAFLNAGPRRLLDQLARIFQAMQQRGEITVQNPIQAAEQFVSMCKGLGDLKRRFGYTESSEETVERISGAVTTFLATYSTSNIGTPLDWTSGRR
jgi:TetR/AcrR family transcriptional repressor of mexJK operon